MEAITREEQLLNSIATKEAINIDPITREEQYLAYIAGLTDKKPEKAITRKEMFYDAIAENGTGGGGGTAKPEQDKTIDITENGTTEVTPDEGKTLSKVTVNTSVVDGEIGKPYIDTSKMTSFKSFIEINSDLLEDVEKIDTSNGVDFERMFYQVTELEICPAFNTSSGTNFSTMFYGCTNLTSIPQFITSNGINFLNMFRMCRKLKTIPLLDISSAINIAWTFGDCNALETVSLTTPKTDLQINTFDDCTALKNITIGEGWAVNIYLHYSNNLTVESLHGMIENLADLTGLTAKIFQVGETNLAKIDEEHLAMLTAKNWSYS